VFKLLEQHPLKISLLFVLLLLLIHSSTSSHWATRAMMDAQNWMEVADYAVHSYNSLPNTCQAMLTA